MSAYPGQATEDLQYDVIIVGGASAGLTAALYTSRQALRTLVITKDIGGQALLTNDIQNYPGFKGTTGFDLMSRFQDMATSYGTQFQYDEVTAIEQREQSCYVVRTATNSEFYCCAVILAFGKTPRDLGVPGEKELKGRGVSYCAVCDGPLFKGKTVGVVGVGDPALDAANYLSGLAGKVYMIQRTPNPIGDEELVETLKARSNVEFLSNRTVVEIKGEKKLESVVLRQSASSSSTEGQHQIEVTELKLDGIFVEMGYVTRTEFVRNLVQLNGLGEIVTGKDGGTSTPGIFACGDVTDIPYKQAVISAGQGAVAGLSAYNYVQGLRGKPSSKSDWRSLKPKGA